jgi:hypothetical protein
MYCQNCGALVEEHRAVCAQCGRPPIRRQMSELSDDPAMRMLLPVGRSGWAIAAGYAGLFAFVFFPAPIALVLGLVALRDLKRHPEKLGKGRAIFGTVTGAIFTLLLVGFGALATIGSMMAR